MKKVFLLFIGCILFSITTLAQINILKKITEKVEQKTEEKIDEGIEKGVNEVFEGEQKNKKTSKNKKQVEDEDESESDENVEEKKQTKKSNTEGQSQEKVSLKASSKYDFVPGDKILLFEDFSQDAVGDFPALWTTSGSGEIKTLNIAPGNWFHLNAADAVYCLEKNLELPENFIFEFDVVAAMHPENQGYDFYLTLFSSEDTKFLNDELYPGTGGVHISVKTDYGWEIQGYTQDDAFAFTGGTEISPIKHEELSHVIVWVQKKRLRIYHNGQKSVDMPSAIPGGNKINRLRFSLWSQTGSPFISNLRFTTAGSDMRSKFLQDGKLITYGIYFDVNSDKVKSESYGTLKQIADMLKENTDIKVQILGHTDSDGDDKKNLDLSKRRAASVKKELVNTFSVPDSMLDTDGKGESEPITDNKTAENKAKNRRVEFIKK